jgi:hypothetical protein
MFLGPVVRGVLSGLLVFVGHSNIILSAQFGESPRDSMASPRITQDVDDTIRTRLTGNLPLLARPEFDQGEAEESSLLTHGRLVLSRGAEQEKALDHYLADLHNKSSVNYHKWLTPEQFGKLYGPADSDMALLVAWLESQGLLVELVSPGRTNIAFSGTVRQIEKAFHTHIHNFIANDQRFSSNTEEPSVPSALSQVIRGISHLDTIRPRAMHTASRPGMLDPRTNRLTSVADLLAQSPGPQLTTGSAGAYSLYITASDAATIYDAPNEFNGNFAGSAQFEGFGVTIGIGGDAIIQSSTVGNYAAFTNGGSFPNIINVDGVTSTADSDEAYIDTELSEALAPRAGVDFYTSTDLFSAIEKAINDNHVDIFSLSFGQCELGLTTATNAQVSAWWQQAAAQGIAVTVATGDNGSAGCDATTDSKGNNVAAASNALQVNGFASTPYNVAVGGTDFYALPAAFSTYVSTASGNPLPDFRSVLKYIPESAWNDSTTANTLFEANVPLTGTQGNIVAGSGGASRCSSNTTTATAPGTCANGYVKPNWQQAIGVPADSARDLPDVSLMAGNGVDQAAWVVCTDDTFTSGGKTFTANCANTGTGFAFSGFGGTSTSAPAFAGILALVQSKTNSRLGQAAQEIYELYNGPHGSSIFHDVTVGNNSVPCVSSSPDCLKNQTGYLYESGYDTTTGYDLATGLGSVDVTELVNYWGSATGTGNPSLTITPSATNIDASQPLTVTVSATGTASLGTPTGTVTLSGGGYSSMAQFLNRGSYVFTLNPAALNVSNDTLTATYTGDPNYAPATASVTISVTGPSLGISTSSLNFPTTVIGTSSTPQSATLKNVGTGPLTISGFSIEDANDGYRQTNTCSAPLAIGASCTVTVTFAPILQESSPVELLVNDNAANSPQVITLKGVSIPPSPAVAFNYNSVSFPNTAPGASSAPQMLTLTNSGGATLAVSTVTVSGSNPSSFMESNNCANVAVNANCQISVTFTPSALGAFSATLTVVDNASPSSQSVALSGTGAEIGTYTLSGGNVTVTPGSSGTSTISATPAGGYSGTITLASCVESGSPAGAIDIPMCTITNSTVTVGASNSTGLVAISTAAPQANLRVPNSKSNPTPKAMAGAGSLLVAGAFIFGISSRGRRVQRMLAIILILAAFGALSACGGNGSSNAPPSNPGTTPGNYTFIVTGTDGAAVKQTATITVTVN